MRVLFLETATRSGHTGYVAILNTVAIAPSDAERETDRRQRFAPREFRVRHRVGALAQTKKDPPDLIEKGPSPSAQAVGSDIEV
jgi:hypothetical protein